MARSHVMHPCTYHNNHIVCSSKQCYGVHLKSELYSWAHNPCYVELNYCLYVQAFEAAWAAACKVEASTVLVPSEHEFVVGPISFSGPNCIANILFQVTLLLIPKCIQHCDPHSPDVSPPKFEPSPKL